MSSQSGILASLLAAVQASLSVLLVISYGSVAAHLQLLTPASTKAISKVCVRMFLPALLVVQIGSQLHVGSAPRYGVILLWALACHFVSFLVGIFAHLVLGMPDWTTVALMFNNTTSYPLLLVSALAETGILQSLLTEGSGETVHEAVERAKSYFLVFATVSSCLTFAVGPRLIDSEHAPEPEDDDDDDDVEDKAGDEEGGTDNGKSSVRITAEARPSVGPSDDRAPTESSPLLLPSRPSVVQFADPFKPGSASSNSFFPSARRRLSSYAPMLPGSGAGSGAATPTRGGGSSSTGAARPASLDVLLPMPMSGRSSVLVDRRPSLVPRRHWARVRVTLSPRAKWWLLFISDFFNAPLVGALVGAIIGLTPPLQRAFFADTADGGVFTAWLTASLKSIGSLFVPLPVVVAGVSLYAAMRSAVLAQRDRVRRRNRRRQLALEGREAGEDDGEDDDGERAAAGKGGLPWGTVAFILFVRFAVWSVVSIATVYLLAKNTDWLGDDPMLWFAMMLMPTGPPAMKLITLVQVSDGDEEDEINIAKLLTISYVISPLLSFTVVGSLRASQAAIHT